MNITWFNNLPLFDEDKSLVLVFYLIESEAVPAKLALEKQVTFGDAAVEELEKDKKALIQEMAGTFEEGFQEALTQASCENPGINISNSDLTHHVVDGKVVPMDLDD